MSNFTITDIYSTIPKEIDIGVFYSDMCSQMTTQLLRNSIFVIIVFLLGHIATKLFYKYGDKWVNKTSKYQRIEERFLTVVWINEWLSLLPFTMLIIIIYVNFF